MRILADVDGDGTYEYVYNLKLVQSLNPTAREESSTLPLPGESAENSIIQNFQGETKEITLTLILYDNGENKAFDNDTSTNTAPTGEYTDDTVETIEEQIHYLQNYVKQPNISAKHQIEGYGLHDPVLGRLLEVDPELDSNNPFAVRCNIRFKVGDVK